MAVMKETKRTATDEILAQLEAAAHAFRNDPELAAAQHQLDAAQAAAGKATAHETACRATRQAIAAQITRPDLVELEARLQERITTIGTRLGSLPPRDSVAQRQFDVQRLRESKAGYEQELMAVRGELASVTKLPTQTQLLAAAPPVRHAYRDADAAYEAAVAATKETMEPLSDARYAVSIAKPKALARVRPRLLEAYSSWVPSYVAALEAVSQETGVGLALYARITAILGPGAIDNVGLEFFTEPEPGRPSKFQAWKDSLRTRVSKVGAR